MRRWILLLFLAVQSCGLHEISGIGEITAGGVWGGPVNGQTGVEPLQSTCYMTAVDYKKGYDWLADQAKENVKCSLVVYVDGVPVMKVPVGKEYEISSDPDMHRVIGGNLYTDYSTETETVVKKNGSTSFRYEGRESLCGMQVIGDDIYTLGQNREGEGFAFRKNGEPLIYRSSGYVVGDLVNDNDTLCFSFSEQITTAEGHVDRYYGVVNGDVFQIAVRPDIEKIWDIVFCNGRVAYLASLIGVAAPVLVDGDRMFSLSAQYPKFMMLSCSLHAVEDRILADGIYMLPNGMIINSLWLDGKILETLPQGYTVSAVDVSEGGVSCAVNPPGQSSRGFIYRDGEVYELPQGYKVMGGRCISMVNGILHVGLSSVENGFPVVWKDAALDTLRINGYISGISCD